MHRLTLYISGKASISARALAAVDRVCEKYLAGRYSLEVVDVLEEPGRAEAAHIVGTPTLVKQAPLPERAVLCGNVDEKRLLRVLGLPTEVVAARTARVGGFAVHRPAASSQKHADRQAATQNRVHKPVVTVRHPVRAAFARALGLHDRQPGESPNVAHSSGGDAPLKRVLVIDDYEGVRSSFELALESAPVELLLAHSGPCGLETLDATDVDLVYLDLNMAEMDGVETLERLRTRHHMPVFVLTAFADEFAQRLSAARNAGLDFELLRKPLEMDEIFLVSGIATGGFGPRETTAA